jgi:hypothetical protein
MGTKFYLLVLMIVFTLLVFTSSNVLSSPDGCTGRTKKTSSVGCGGCHSQGANVTAVITGPNNIITGQTYTFTLTITTTGNKCDAVYGVDIAAKTGTLATISGQGLKLSNGELTHNSPLSYSNPKTITFKYTAPAVPGTDTLFANVNKVDGLSSWNWVPNKSFRVGLATGISNSDMPVEFNLSQNFPNPFNPTTVINFAIPQTSAVTLDVYDMTGKLVSTLISNETRTEGSYSYQVDGSALSSGMYIYRLTAGNFSGSRKMILIK